MYEHINKVLTDPYLFVLLFIIIRSRSRIVEGPSEAHQIHVNEVNLPANTFQSSSRMV